MTRIQFRWLLFLVGIVLVWTETVQAQRRQGSGLDRSSFGRGSREDRGGMSGRRRFGGMGGRWDPRRIADMVFTRMTGGKDVLVISEAQSQFDPTIQDRLKAFAEKEGISNGQLTREQFAKYMEQRMAERRAGSSGPSGSASSPSSDRGRSASRSGTGEPRRGLAPPTPPGRGSDSSSRSSSSGDRGESRGWEGGYYPWPTTPEPEEEKKTVVYTADNLPKELQSGWFAQLDKDRDGQVGLYEWKKAGRSTRDFRVYDDNADGFVTAEEASRHLGIKAISKGGTTVASNGRSSSGGSSPFNRFRRAGFSRTGGSSRFGGRGSSAGGSRFGRRPGGFTPGSFPSRGGPGRFRGGPGGSGSRGPGMPGGFSRFRGGPRRGGSGMPGGFGRFRRGSGGPPSQGGDRGGSGRRR